MSNAQQSTMFNADPDRPIRQILDNIQSEAVRGGQSGNLTYMLPAFAALLVRLSRDADAQLDQCHVAVLLDEPGDDIGAAPAGNGRQSTCEPPQLGSIVVASLAPQI
jgi:hypothetical protein